MTLVPLSSSSSVDRQVLINVEASAISPDERTFGFADWLNCMSHLSRFLDRADRQTGHIVMVKTYFSQKIF